MIEFDNWIKEKGWSLAEIKDLFRKGDGPLARYCDNRTQGAWESWEAWELLWRKKLLEQISIEQDACADFLDSCGYPNVADDIRAGKHRKDKHTEQGKVQAIQEHIQSCYDHACEVSSNEERKQIYSNILGFIDHLPEG